ncbi:MAG TPA: hypothetical protein VD735_00485 [Candidatus Saccharimonadales bacterium]|nr:hypothetical protein [Candidatus Saccharimonadales bacterium]
MSGRDIPKQMFDAFYRPLVGTPDRTMAFYGRLATAVDGSPSPYADLEQHLVLEYKEAATAIPQANAAHAEYVSRIESNTLPPARLAVGALRSIGELYSSLTEAGLPAQYPGSVHKNVSGAMEWVRKLAYIDGPSSAHTIKCTGTGEDPADVPLHAANGALEITPYSFITSIGADKQLQIEPMFPAMRSLGPDRCPAVDARVATENDRTRSGLYVVMQTIGCVAANVVYPAQFDIASPQQQAHAA